MSETECLIFIDHNQHTYLQYRDSGKVRHFVTLRDGSIDCIQLHPKDYLRFKKYVKHTPEHFAEVYLSSYLAISRQARVILRGILGHSSELEAQPEATSFSGGSVGLQEICEASGWEPSKARKFLRKLIEKPGGRWEWSPEEAQKISGMLKECFASEDK